MSTASYVSKIIHDIVALVLFIFALVMLGVSVGVTKETDMPLFLTYTFHTTYYPHHPALTWSQPIKPLDNKQVASTFFNCLRVAGVGAEKPVSCAGLSDAKYESCLHNRTTSMDYINKRITDSVEELIKATSAPADARALLTGMPAVLTANNNLDAFNMRLGLIDTFLASIGTPFSRQVRHIYNRATHYRGIQGCIDQADANGDFRAPLASTYDELWKCASEVLPTTQAQAFRFQQCVPLSAWPARDELQTVYSQQFLGSYNHIHLALVSAWIMASFAVYTFWVGDSRSSEIGRPLDYFGRTGLFLAGLCTIWNALGAIVPVAAFGFREATSWGQRGFPFTIQNLLITGVVTIAGTGYFLLDCWEQLFHMNRDAPMYPPQILRRQITVRGKTMVPLGGYARVSNSASPLDDSETAPWVVFPWSDAWLLTDGLLLLAIVGTSPDVVTADAGRLFLAATYAAAAQSAFIRLFYEGYYNNSEAKSKTGLRVMIFLVQIAILWFSVINWWLIFQRYGNVGLIVAFPLLTSLLPMLVWFIFSIAVEWGLWLSVPLTQVAQVGFILNALFRLIFFIIILSTATVASDPNAKLKDFLNLMEPL
jgi:hypothetical protein